MLTREYPDLYIDGGWREPDSHRGVRGRLALVRQADRPCALGVEGRHRRGGGRGAPSLLRDRLVPEAGPRAGRTVPQAGGGARRTPGGVRGADRGRAGLHEVPGRRLRGGRAHPALELCTPRSARNTNSARYAFPTCRRWPSGEGASCPSPARASWSKSPSASRRSSARSTSRCRAWARRPVRRWSPAAPSSSRSQSRIRWRSSRWAT